MAESPTFQELVAEGESAPINGWDFSWFEGRATEERPSWGYARILRDRLPGVNALLDLQTGGGEVLAEVLGQITQRPALISATEGWRPNVDIARRNLAPFGGAVVEVADTAGLPFAAGSFDTVISRHPTVVLWQEIARVLRPGGVYLAQLVGSGSQRELYEFMLGPQPADDSDPRQRVIAAAEAAGLTALDVRHESLPAVFYDVGAVVHFLRKVVWTVPDFTVARYRHRLAALHDRITSDGAFVSHAQRLLVEVHSR